MTENSSAVPTAGTLSKREIYAYSLPRFGSAAMFMTVGIFLPIFYTDTLKLAPAFIAWTFLIGRLWDGVTDPVMGYVSDRTRSRMGRRRPYFLISAIPVAIAFYLMWSPPETLQDRSLFIYLTVTYLLTFTFWTIFSIPHNSLGAELTMDYHERTLITGVREALGVFGTLIGTLAPPILAGIYGSQQKGYSIMAAWMASATCLFIFICFFNVKENPEFQKQHPLSLGKGLIALSRNRPFRILVIAFMIALIGNAFVPILTLYIAKYVIKVSQGIATAVIVSYMLAVVASIVFWTRLSRRIGKTEAWRRALIFTSVIFFASFYYHAGTWIVWIVLAALAGFGYGCTLALGYSMMADVIDLDELETGRRREGAYFGIWFFVEKGAVGLTAFIGMYTLEFLGYIPDEAQTPQVWWAMKFLYSILPGICFAACYFLLRGYPIDRKEHERIRAEIEAKKNSDTVELEQEKEFDSSE
jgi:GPH family glycoside/pentoside/hexuronide:cation symporter